MADLPALAYVNGRLATELLDVTTDPAALDSTGFWVLVKTYEGELTAARFGHVREASPAGVRPRWPWRGPALGSWLSSIDEGTYLAAVDKIRDYIAGGEVYQANLCRVMSAPLPDPDRCDVVGLARLLGVGNPAPYASVVRLPKVELQVVSASPELYLGRNGRQVVSRPIKGTGRTVADLLPKDHAENVMIVDLVRNDLGRVSEIGTIAVPQLCAVEEHPGLVHLVSTVTGRLRSDVGWPQLFAATFPPGSVTGAPKSSAVRIIEELEPVSRGPYCGAIGWVDADRQQAELAVGIRTFWVAGGRLHFGTGAGITWGSDPAGEWAETELKADRLIALASG
ncbi:MAG TPA: chorismate-binding protein [Actinomycetes bacterium]|nr:chorismate-binding protein [Actinomycetes bacterium]